MYRKLVKFGRFWVYRPIFCQKVIFQFSWSSFWPKFWQFFSLMHSKISPESESPIFSPRFPLFTDDSKHNRSFFRWFIFMTNWLTRHKPFSLIIFYSFCVIFGSLPKLCQIVPPLSYSPIFFWSLLDSYFLQISDLLDGNQNKVFITKEPFFAGWGTLKIWDIIRSK